MGMFTSLIDYDKVYLESQSVKRKYSFNLQLQDVVPTWHLQDKRKTLNTNEERTELASGSGLTIIGDPVLDLYSSTKHFLCECNVCKFKIIVQKSYFHGKTINCINCLNNKHYKEASTIGLELIGKATDSDPKRRNYKFIKCGHTRDIATGDVRVGSVSCTECYKEEFERNVDESGFQNLSWSHSKGTAQYYNVRYKDCGHERIAGQPHLMTKTVGPCQICYEENLARKVLEEYNVTVLEKHDNKVNPVQ
jgi:hypothetical protein